MNADSKRDIVDALQFFASERCVTKDCGTRCRQLIVEVLALPNTEPDHETLETENRRLSTDP